MLDAVDFRQLSKQIVVSFPLCRQSKFRVSYQLSITLKLSFEGVTHNLWV